MKTLKILTILFLALIVWSCDQNKEELTPKQAEQIAEEAYIYAYPMIDHYKMMFAMAIYPESGAYFAPFNIMSGKTSLAGPKDTVIVRPNNDTYYSAVWFDLSDQPQILSVPAINSSRYYSFQIVDMYTHNIDYIGSRKTGNSKGSYMFVGPGWDGETPNGIEKLIKSEGNYVVAIGRTQVFGPNDMDNAKAVMAQYHVEPLSAFLGKESANQKSMPEIPPYNPEKVKGIQFISYLNAIMETGRIHESEKDLFKKFSKIGIVPGEAFDESSLSPEIKTAIEEGIKNATAKIEAETAKLGKVENGWQLIAGAFGAREDMQGKYLTRAAAANFGLWGNTLEEAYYPEASVDADGDALDGSKNNYVLHFDADALPPVKAFWSLSMYKLPEQLFIENEINRYVISSATEGLKYNEDGSLDVYIQKENPGKDKESNWLPAHDGLFSLQARLYWPDQASLDPLYAMPAIKKN
jgi:hypothetical protein